MVNSKGFKSFYLIFKGKQIICGVKNDQYVDVLIRFASLFNKEISALPQVQVMTSV